VKTEQIFSFYLYGLNEKDKFKTTKVINCLEQQLSKPPQTAEN
jgi:hypothetical protein